MSWGLPGNCQEKGSSPHSSVVKLKVRRGAMDDGIVDELPGLHEESVNKFWMGRDSNPHPPTRLQKAIKAEVA